MPDWIFMPQEYEDLQRRLSDIVEPALLQKEKIRKLFDDASFSLPKMSGYIDEIPGIKIVVSSGSIPHITISELVKQYEDSLAQWENSAKIISEKFQELREYAEQKLLSENSSLKKWGEFGWTIAPNSMPRDYYYVPKSKEEADNLMLKIHNDKETKEILAALRKCKVHSQKDIDEIEILYDNEQYKPCALMLFTMIDSLLIHTQDNSQYAEERGQGNTGIRRFNELAEPEDCMRLTTRVLSFIASVSALHAFFESTGKNFQCDSPVLNRHLICHGMLQREVNKTDCIQLILLYRNMLHCVGIKLNEK